MNDYPRNFKELEKRFPTDATCRKYLEDLRWPDVFRCPNPKCNGTKWWRSGELRRCATCQRQCSVTAGTIFQDTRKPLTLWFRAIWSVTNQEYGATAMEIQRILELHSYQTAWAWLHKLRRAMSEPNQEPIAGTVEIDSILLENEDFLDRGGGPIAAVAVAVTARDDGKQGITRLRVKAVSDDLSQATISAFAKQTVAPKSTIRTEDCSRYETLSEAGYRHKVVPHYKLMAAKQAVSALKRRILVTHKGAVSPEHLGYYLDEYMFRVNNNGDDEPGLLFCRLLQNAVRTTQTTYRQIVRNIRGPKPSSRRQ